MLTDDDLPPLPEPVATLGTKLVPYEERLFRLSALAAKMGYTHNLKAFYTADQMREYGRAVEQAAYEAAYRAVKGRDTGDMQREDIEARRCAEAIAELMQEQPK